MMNDSGLGKITAIFIYAIIGGIMSYLAAIGLGGYLLVAMVLYFIYSYVKKHYYRNRIVKIALEVFLKEFGIEGDRVFHCAKMIGDSEAFHTHNGTFIAIDNEGKVAEFHVVYVMREADYDEWLEKLLKDFADLGNDAVSNINWFYPREGENIVDDIAVYKFKYTIDLDSTPDNLYAILAQFIKEHEPKTEIKTHMEVKDSNDHYILWFRNDALVQCWFGKIDEEMEMKIEILEKKWWSLNLVNYNKEAEKQEVKIIS